MFIFDGHLDLAGQALQLERDPRLTVDQQRAREAAGVPDRRGVATVGLAEMRRAGIATCVATVLARCKPWMAASRPQPRVNSDWPTPEMAHGIARGHLAWYLELERQGQWRIVRRRGDLQGPASGARRPPSVVQRPNLGHAMPDTGPRPSDADPPPLALILTMEGADPVVEPDQLEAWWRLGLRTLMLAHFGKSRYAHGTPAPHSSASHATAPANPHDVDGPLTDRGHALLREMHRLDMPLDLSHLSDASFADAAANFPGPIYASHASCRSLVPGNEKVHPMRMLTNAQCRTIFKRDGVIGLPLFNAFLKAGYGPDTETTAVTLDDVADHIDHLCQLAGDARHIALGSDLDGGFGREHTPAEIDTIADLPRLADPLRRRGYDDDTIAAILGDNWQRFYQRVLPA